MKRVNVFTVGTSVLFASGVVAMGAVKAEVGFNDASTATPDFKFSNVPAPSQRDAASKALFYLVTGKKDDQSGDLFKLHDGKLPASADAAGENFFFKAGTEGGRLVIDLGQLIDVKQINSYSWHSGTHAAQVYVVYGSDGKAKNFSAEPFREGGPESSGWKRITKVDTRPNGGNGAGQYGVSITDSKGIIDSYRYLMFDFSPTESADGEGNTYLSEIDVIDANAPTTASAVVPAPTQLAGAGTGSRPDGANAESTVFGQPLAALQR